MQIFLFFALFIAILAIIFAVQNNDPATVSFFFWKWDGSLALVLLVSLATGALISFMASLPANIKARWTIRKLRKKLAEFESSLVEIEPAPEPAATGPIAPIEEPQAEIQNQP